MIDILEQKICLRHYDSVWSIDRKPDTRGIYHWDATFFLDNRVNYRGSTFDLSLGLHEMIAARNQYYHSTQSSIKAL